jgi:large subunit ribosomal protein L30
MTTKKIKIQRIGSGIARQAYQGQTLIGLGLKRNNQIVEKTATPEVLGMVRRVQHLVKVLEA